MNFNYTLEKTLFLKEKNSTGYMYKHKSGANIIFLKNKDENRVFSISFKTPVENNTGVAHALEHIILTGSRKYPIRDPFNELSKSSLYTYLNAMTFRDKTMYPIASCNEIEYKKLMDVYLDAVFNPLLRKEMFLQEGINYIFEDDIIEGFGGIVYNEMLGVYSDPVEILENANYENLFKTTHYKYDSGGNPKFIQDLTYEDLKKFYEKYYIPSNAYIYLYGDLDIDYYLDYIDKEYLVKPYENIKILYKKETCKVDNIYINTYYNCDEDDLSEKKYLSAAFLIGESTENKLMISVEILKYYLFSNSSSPLKDELLKQQCGKDIATFFDTDIINPVFTILAKYTDKEINSFKNIIITALKKIVTDGIDIDLMNGCINKIEFNMREENYGYKPKGLAYNIFIMSNWLNDKDPFLALENFKYIEEIRKELKNNYFENIIDKYFVKNNSVVYNTLSPKKDLKNKDDILLKEKINNLNKTYTKEKLNSIKNELDLLEKFQNTEDNEHDLKKIKPIKIKDINTEIETINTEIFNIDNTKIIYHDLNTTGVFYLQLMFETSKIDIDLIPYIGILNNVLGDINTSNRSDYELLKDTKSYFGGLNFTFETFDNVDDSNSKEFLVLKVKGLYRNSEKIFEIIEDIILNTNIYNIDKIIKNLNQIHSKYKKSILNNAHSYGINRAKSYFNLKSNVSEKVIGIDFFDFLDNLLKDKNIKEKLCKNLEILIENIFIKNNLTISLTCEKNEKNKILISIEKLYSVLKYLDYSESTIPNRFLNKNINESFQIGSNLMYNIMAVDLNKKNIKYDGAMAVLSSILEDDYLIEQIRLKGGAYGCGSSINRKGEFIFYSFRDPELYETIQTYKEIGNYIKNLKLSKEELDKYIIGTINKMDKPMLIETKAMVGTIRYLTGVTEETIGKRRLEILNTNIDTINKFAFIFEDLEKEAYFTILGNVDKRNDDMVKTNIKFNKNIKLYL